MNFFQTRWIRRLRKSFSEYLDRPVGHKKTIEERAREAGIYVLSEEQQIEIGRGMIRRNARNIELTMGLPHEDPISKDTLDLSIKRFGRQP